jgi:hypothetical protein
MAEKSKVTIVREYLGRPGQPAKEFLEEYRRLTDTDCQELAELICKQTGDTISTK